MRFPENDEFVYDLQIAEDAPFTNSQRLILGKILEGVTSSEAIGKALGITDKTVRNTIEGQKVYPAVTYEMVEEIPSILGILGILQWASEKRYTKNRFIGPLVRAGLVEMVERDERGV